MLTHALILQEPAIPAAQLILLCHAAGADAASLQPLGERLRATFPSAAIVSLQANGTAAGGYAWFAEDDLTEEVRAQRVAEALPALQCSVRHWQKHTGVDAMATPLIGVSQGAELVLEISKSQPMLASRVVALGGRYTTLPEAPPAVITTHFIHGREDAVVHYRHCVTAAHHLRDRGCDITAEVVPFIDDALHPDLIALAVTRLSTHIAPQLWTAAQEAAALQRAADTP